MKPFKLYSLLLAFVLLLPLALTGCGGENDSGDWLNGSDRDNSQHRLPEPDGQGRPGPVPGESRVGESYDVKLTGFDGQTITITVHEPGEMMGGETYPLLLFGHGFGGSRMAAFARNMPGSDQPGGSIAGLPKVWLDEGYGQISIDQRGHNQSTGEVRLLDPEVEGRYLVQILDWAEANLDWLAYRDNNLLVGSMGASYGGLYQLLLNNVDPRRRLDAMIPQVTAYDLSYSLNAGNVPKTTYALGLTLAGELSSRGNMYPESRDALSETLMTNRVPQSFLDDLRYRSNRYFCEGVEAPGRKVPSAPPPAVDVLFLQGMADVVFNLNEAFANYNCMSAAAGRQRDVRMFAYQQGHVMPSGTSTLLPPPDMGLPHMLGCGPYDEFTLSRNWFDAKLKRSPEAIAFVESMPEHCLALDGAGDAVALDSIPVGGTPTPEFTALVPQGLLALPTASPITLYTAEKDGEVVAGIPIARIQIEPVAGEVTDNSDAIIFVALVHGRSGLPGSLEIIDDQVRPVRGFGEHVIELNGIADRLDAGDQVQVMITGVALPQYAMAVSRDVMHPVVQVSGQIELPLLGPLPAVIR